MPALAAILLLFMQPDSAGLVSQARRAQAEFERVRMFLLPPGVAGSGGRCDARIGRFCYWSDGRADLPREPARIGRERARLLAALDSAALALPGDGWVAGQRVRYLLEAGRAVAATDAARACRAAAWWCAALEGLAEHEAGDYESAERAFGAALHDMPDDVRCRWSDLSDLLEEPLRGRYHRLPCGERRGFEARVWWLAQPLWSTRGNDRRTEHYARVTMARLLEHSRSPYGFWGDDERELIVRYGWPAAWERADGGGTREPAYIGHEPEPSFHFLPDARAVDDPARGDEPGSFAARDALERYAPRYAASFLRLEPAFAAFLRGDSTLVVATYDVSGDTSFQGSGREAALVLARGPGTPPAVERRAGAALRGALVAQAPWAPALLSLELREPERRVAARARAPALVPAAGAVALSGILLFEPDDSLPPDLPSALARVHAGAIRSGQRIGLYWEGYGLAPGADVSTAVTVTPERTTWLRRFAAALGLASRRGRVRVEWREMARPAGGRTARALVLDLRGLDAGRYRIGVRVAPRSGAPAAATRRLDVVAN
jgi:hypothetical protein